MSHAVTVGTTCFCGLLSKGGGNLKKRSSERLLRRTVPLANPLTVCSSWRSGGRKNELWNFITPGPPLMQLTSYSEPGYLDKQHNEKDWLFLGKTAQATTMNTRWRWITSIMGSCVLDTLSLRGPDRQPESLIQKLKCHLNIWKSRHRKIKTCLSVEKNICLGSILYVLLPVSFAHSWLLLKIYFDHFDHIIHFIMCCFLQDKLMI